ncbi:hypothetical protein [Natroniella sp. ANB-PHB2]|uniref:hypothetical protein n=1 Tax=Natroniella sp. ANB-PHB2 TaxID=3384444 RepID=UPI0038D35EA2
MWIENKNKQTKKLKVKGLTDGPIFFSANGTAQVPEEVGKELVERFESIVVKEVGPKDKKEGDD